MIVSTHIRVAGLPCGHPWGNRVARRVQNQPTTHTHTPLISPALCECPALAPSGSAISRRDFLGKHRTLIHRKINQNDTSRASYFGSAENGGLQQISEAALGPWAPLGTRTEGRAWHGQQCTRSGHWAMTGPRPRGRGDPNAVSHALPRPAAAGLQLHPPLSLLHTADDVQMHGPSASRRWAGRRLLTQGLWDPDTHPGDRGPLTCSLFSLFQLDKGPETPRGENCSLLRARTERGISGPRKCTSHD